MRRERRSADKEHIAQNTEKLVGAIRAAEILISTSSEETVDAIKRPKIPILPLILKSSSVINATKHNITTCVDEALT